jgi:hypothetical protein
VPAAYRLVEELRGRDRPQAVVVAREAATAPIEG